MTTKLVLGLKPKTSALCTSELCKKGYIKLQLYCIISNILLLSSFIGESLMSEHIKTHAPPKDLHTPCFLQFSPLINFPKTPRTSYPVSSTGPFFPKTLLNDPPYSVHSHLFSPQICLCICPVII